MTKVSKNTYFERDLLNQIKKWIDRKEIFAIKGPRQSGKTTLLRMLADYLIKEKKVNPKNIVFITLEDRDILEKFEKDAKSYIKNYLESRKQRVYFFIDEFQYLHQGGQKIKLLYDLFSEQAKFIITGSSSLELTGQTAKYLVGRLFSFYLWPLSFSESLKINSDFFHSYQKIHQALYDFMLKGKNFKIPDQDIWQNDLEKLFKEHAQWGGYPEIIKSKSAEIKYLVLKNIYDTYIRRDIIELLKVKSIDNLRNLIKILSAEIGNLINYNNLANDSKTYFQELKQYLAVLDETYILKFLTPYFKNPITELKKNPKIYFFDLGLRNYILNNFNALEERSDKGALIENAVFNELYKNLPEQTELKYWRTIAKAEVDFVLLTGQEIVPIEVKYSFFDKPKISRSFRSFISQYQPNIALILTKGFFGEMKIDKTLVKFAPVWYI